MIRFFSWLYKLKIWYPDQYLAVEEEHHCGCVIQLIQIAVTL
jgi:hypothetical protein